MYKGLFIFFILLMPYWMSGQVEICDNGIDDDNDSLIDINDDDCICEIVSSASLIVNPSFEELDCCPDDKSQLYCASGWVQASTPTTDLIHLCGWSGVREYPPPLPFPDGEGILGIRNGRTSSSDPADAFWKEYAGACLTGPMMADSLYRFEFEVGFVDAETSPPINMSFFGTTSCDHLPFGPGNAAFGCPSNSPDWEKIGDVLVSGGDGNTWVRAAIEVIPDVDIYAIAIGPDCDTMSTPDVIYYYLDDLVLNPIADFDLQIAESAPPCDDGFMLSVPDNVELSYQWYLSGVALAGETTSSMQRIYGEGAYQVRVLSGSTCRVSAVYDYTIPVTSSADTTSICQGDTYPFGDRQLTDSGFYMDTLLARSGCDSIISLILEVVGQSVDTLAVTIAPGSTYQLGLSDYTEVGEYAIAIPSSLGCDSLLLLQLDHHEVYIPNVFDSDNAGELGAFYPFAAANVISSYDMKIYDRWGNLVYQGKSWDGSDHNEDIFVYIITIDFANGGSSTFYGDVTLMR